MTRTSPRSELQDDEATVTDLAAHEELLAGRDELAVDGVVLRRMSTASWEHVWMLNAASGTVYAGTSQVQRDILAGFRVGGTLSCERPPSFLP